MKQVAKLVIINNNDRYLLMYRNEHPTFGNDPDLPGGTLEDGELPLETKIREVYEEAGVVIEKAETRQLYEGTDYSLHKTHYSLYVARLDYRPNLTVSWEHLSYEWLNREDFLERVKHANDTYLHVVYDMLK
ncbi:MAG: NUDIX hydrolase [Candidatus Saccharibacteria bacterium]